MVVPCTLTLALAIASPVVLVTRPVTRRCAEASALTRTVRRSAQNHIPNFRTSPPKNDMVWRPDGGVRSPMPEWTLFRAPPPHARSLILYKPGGRARLSVFILGLN